MTNSVAMKMTVGSAKPGVKGQGRADRDDFHRDAVPDEQHHDHKKDEEGDGRIAHGETP
jgi:hypothetical protein